MFELTLKQKNKIEKLIKKNKIKFKQIKNYKFYTRQYKKKLKNY